MDMCFDDEAKQPVYLPGYYFHEVFSTIFALFCVNYCPIIIFQMIGDTR